MENEPGHDISDTIGSDEEVNRLLARPPFGISSIAVLPFQNMSENLEHHHFVDGICEDIITALTKVPRLFVLGRVSLSNYRDRPVDIQAIGRELDVQYVLEGSVRCSDNRFRITAQLIETSTGDHIWAERFDREMQNIFALQDEMTREVITALQVELVDGEDARLWSSGTTNYQAWEAVMKARELCLTRRKFNVIAGRKLAQKAIALDENYGGAWNWLGYSYWAETLGGWSDDTVLALSLAKEAAERGLEIDETNAGMLGLLALVMISMRQYETANELAHRAIEFGPNNNYAIGCAGAIKMYCNELELAESMLRKAMKLAPLYKAGNPEILAATLMLMKRYDEAIVAANECLELDPDYFYAYCTLAIVYCELGRDQDAALAARNILRINPEYTVQTFAVHQPFQDKESLNRCLAGLRKAGIPEG
ncbi:tetratricopeptide repeat protein [Parasphingorhabdus sp.]|uniref:tetratricopeptide repeat protein n=1 Tax=Parasphingorhabdus sp. TaxID=2709688 RepID=UPI0032673FEB